MNPTMPNLEDGESLFNFVVRDGNGVKGMVDMGLSRVPQRYLQPPEERIDDNKVPGNCSHMFPPIDLSKLEDPAGHEYSRVVKEIAQAAETLGFFQVVNHGMPVELLESLKDAAHQFFAQPPEKKAVYLKGSSPTHLVKYGTSFAPGKEKALEWKDYISMVYTNDEEALEFWPHLCKEVALEYLRKSAEMVKRILRVLVENLGVKLEEPRLDALVGLKMVNMNYYPACPDPELTIGVGRHSDVGTLTVLLQDGIGGLYVKVEGRDNIDTSNTIEDDKWLEIPPIPGALVINVGDTLQILSNGRYRSAEHRVRTTSTQSRVSIPMFSIPRPEEKIGPLTEVVKKDDNGVVGYREVVFQDYMNNFFGNAHDGKKSLDFARA